MVGYNNEWSLAESHIFKFLNKMDRTPMKIRAMVMLDNIRLFKVLRYGYLKFVIHEKSDYMDRNKYYVWGHPELARVPPEKWIYSFANSNRDAFIKLWRYDVNKIIQNAKTRNTPVLLMTYHINPTYLPEDEFISMAERYGVPLVRNDESFKQLIENKTIDKYLLYDHWHPNKEGYSIIANNAFECIKKTNLLK